MIFTAAGAHMAVNMCDDTNLAVSAYESFVTFNPLHIQLFLNTGINFQNVLENRFESQVDFRTHKSITKGVVENAW